MQKINADQARKRKNMTFYYKIHETSSTCTPALTLHAALENGSIVPAGCNVKGTHTQLRRHEIKTSRVESQRDS